MKKVNWKAGILVVFCLVSIMTSLTQARSESDRVVDEKLVKSVLKGKFGAVRKAIDREDCSSVERLLLGHSLLADNRPNEALDCFLNVSGEGLEEWVNWTSELARNNPKNPIARYLEGDAFARVSKTDQAIEALSRGIKLDRDNSLLLNARGVCYALKKDWNSARADLDAATKGKPRLSDAFCSRASMLMHKQAGSPEAALEYFEQALSVSKNSRDSILAFNGKIAAYSILGRYEEAKTDLQKVQQIASELSSEALELVVISNIYALASARSEAASEMLIAAGIEPGTTLTREDILRMPDWEIASLKGTLDNDISWNQAYLPIAPDTSTFEIGSSFTDPFSLSASFTWNEHDRTAGNLASQQANLDMLDIWAPHVEAESLNPVQSWGRSQFDWDTYKYTHGGVTTEGIEKSTADTWNQAVLYGLAYPGS